MEEFQIRDASVKDFLIRTKKDDQKMKWLMFDTYLRKQTLTNAVK